MKMEMTFDGFKTSKESFTWSELIEEALTNLGAQRTGQEITSYIENHYEEMLENKTKTWKNSVMGYGNWRRRGF